MRRLFVLLCLSLGSALAQEQQPAPVGQPLPADYNVTSVSTNGGFQVITAWRGGDQSLNAIALARDRRTGRTLWKTYASGVLVAEKIGRGKEVVVLTAIYSGAITTAETFLLRLRDGKLLKRGLFKVPDVRDGKVLLVTYGQLPMGDPFLADPSQLTGEVLNTHTGRTLTRNFPVPKRQGCGNLRPIPVSSNMQQFKLDGAQLLVPREDRCGRFQAVFDWTKVPLPKPTIR